MNDKNERVTRKNKNKKNCMYTNGHRFTSGIVSRA